MAPTASAQASFDDLGTHLSQVTFCIVDLETTGGAETDMITEFGAVKVRGGEVLGEFQTLVNPRSHIPPLIAVLTGITNQMVAQAPALREVLAGVPGVRPGHGHRGPQRALRRRLPPARLRVAGVPVPPLAGAGHCGPGPRHPAPRRGAQLQAGHPRQALPSHGGTQPPRPDRRAGHGRRAARPDRTGGQPRRPHHRGPAGVQPTGVAAAPGQAHLGRGPAGQARRLPVRGRARRAAPCALRRQVEEHPQPRPHLLHGG